MPRTASTRAPKTSSWAILAGGAFSGTKITHGMPTLAARQAIELPALPVLAPAMTLAPFSRALTSATAPARSLNEALGLSPSSLIYRCLSPTEAPSRPAA